MAPGVKFGVSGLGFRFLGVSFLGVLPLSFLCSSGGTLLGRSWHSVSKVISTEIGVISIVAPNKTGVTKYFGDLPGMGGVGVA